MKKILILYASQTGMTMDVATTLQEQLVEKWPEIHFAVMNVRDMPAAQLADYPTVIFGSSTWDHGIPAPDGEDFLDRLTSEKPNLAGSTFALFGVGDSAYPEFCGALPLMQSDLELCHGQVDLDFFEIDGYADKTIMAAMVEWASNFIAKTQTI